MPIRKILKIILPLLLCLLLLKPLCLAGIGFYAKFYLRSKWGWDLQYEAIAWKKKGICFSHLTLVDAQGSSLFVAKAIASFSKRHIAIEQAHLDLAAFTWEEGREIGPWTFSIQKGSFTGAGIEPGHFTFEKSSLAEMGKLSLFWDRAQMHVRAALDQGGMVVEGEFHQFDPLLLKRWAGDLWQGSFTGAFSLICEEGTWMAKRIHVEGSDVSRQGVFEGMNLVLDWRESLAGTRDVPFTKGSFEGAKFHTARCAIEEGRGSWSFDGSLGGKWECEGLFNQKRLAFEGRSFFKSLQFPWIEAALRYEKTSLVLSGVEEGLLRKWRIEGADVSAELLSLLQDVGSIWDSRMANGAILAGTFDGAATAVESGGEIRDWNIEHFRIRESQILHPHWKARIGQMEIRENRLSFEGIDFETDNQKIAARGWGGEGKIDEKTWKAAGAIQGVKTALTLQGDPGAFSGLAAISGPWNGAIPFSGSWEEASLHLSFQGARLEELTFEGEGSVGSDLSFSFSFPRFAGSFGPLLKNLSLSTPFSGRIEARGEGFRVEGNWTSSDWSLQAKLSQGQYPLKGTARFEQIEADVFADPSGLSLYDARGVLSAGKKLPFSCPIFQTNGLFDFRLQGKTRDFARIAGEIQEKQWVLDRKKSHLWGISFGEGRGKWENGELGELLIEIDLPWKMISSFAVFPPRFPAIDGTAEMKLSYTPGQGASLAIRAPDLKWNQVVFPLQGTIRQRGSTLYLESCTWGDFSLGGEFSWEENHLHWKQGKIAWRESLRADVAGKCDLFGKGECAISHFYADLSRINQIPPWLDWSLEKVDGTIEGEGSLRWNERLECDFDLQPTQLKIGTFALENRTSMQLYYASDQGFSFRGLDLQVMKAEIDMPWIHCKIGLLQFDPTRTLWILTHAHFHLPADFQTLLKKKIPYLEAIAFEQPLDFLADIECASDFSTISARVKEGFIPWQKEMRHIQNLHLLWNEELFTARFDLFHQTHLLKIGVSADLSPSINGRFSIGEGSEEMVFDWTFDDRLRIQTIEGGFGGLAASFHFEGESLIGSAHLDFHTLSDLIPQRIAAVFADLKMGKGYELMGRLWIEPEGISFRGLLSGKQLELFGYQLRTLLAQVEIEPDRVRIYDVKISDSAGIMKIDEIVAGGVGTAPWTLSIPHITILELRPSLLQKSGGGPGEISPLVVRQLHIDNLKGLLEEGKTWTAQGELYFINSYKRERTVFDIPSDVLSRIVGLDLDLLVPVCGTLRYELKEGFFRLTQLEDSFSENHRSEFFLVEGEDSPTVDLDGNVKILIKMKQFVLFKFTESFLISIEGKLNDPQFHLQKKRRFAELLGL